MSMKRRFLFSLLAAIGLAVIGRAYAAEPAATPPDADKPAAAADRSIREQSIYIPYQKLREVFEKHGRGVFLPYEKFDELWRAAQEKTRPAAEPRPPVGAVITDIENEATVAKDVVQVKARLKIDLLAEGWHEVSLGLADAAIVSASLGGQPARILGGAGQDYRLLVEKKGKKSEQIELALEYARAITRSPGQNSVSFRAPQAPVSRWRVRIPQSGVKVNFYPLIAATEVPVAAPAPKPAGKPTAAEKPSPAPAAKADETVVLAFVGASPTVRIEWTPKAEGATGMTAVASVQAEQQVWVQEGVTRSRTKLDYAVSRAELSQLSIEVPADYKVVNVFDPNVRQWTVEPVAKGAAVQRVVAQLYEPVKAAQQAVVELEKITGQKPQETLTVPVVKALGVGRQQGFLVVQVAAGLRAETARTSGLLQVDASELPRGLAAPGWTFAYRYATVPFELQLSVEEVKPRITTDSLVEARLEPERLTVDLTAVYNIERCGVFKLELDVPPGFAVRHVRGRDLPGKNAAAAVEVDSHHLEGEKKDHLVVNLTRKALGRVGLTVRLQKDLKEPNLLTPTGHAADIPLPLPLVSPASVERAVGRLVIYAPEGLRVNPAKTDGLRSISVKEALDGIPSAQDAGSGGDLRPVLAFAFTKEPTALRLAAERRKPQVTIRQLLVARIEEGVIRYQATFYYTILYSGVKSLRIDVPADLAASIRNTTPGIREKTIDPPPAGLAKDMVAWSLAGDSELFGEGKIVLVWEKKIDKLEVGKSVDLVVPRLVPKDVDRAWGQIVLAKAETLDIHPGEPQGLRPIDPQHDLMSEVAGGARAFEFQADWKLPITVTRYQLEEMKRTSIDRAVVRMVLTPAGEIAVQALYRVRSAQQRLAMSLPTSAAFDTEPLRINSQPVAMEKGEAGQLFVPLSASSADEPLLLELRYTVPGGRQLDLPFFPESGDAKAEEAAVQKVYLCAFVPRDKALLGTIGPWTQESQWYFADGRWAPLNRQDDKALVNWVREGVRSAGTAADSFHTDGTLYVFSTLRPPPHASLVINTTDRRGLAALLFAIVVLGGLALVPAGAATRALAVGALIVVLVLAGVFLPTLSLQILNVTLFAAIFIVLVVWAMVFMFRLRPALAGMAACCASWRTRPKAPPPRTWEKVETELAKSEQPETPPAPPTSEGGPSHE
jgi:hypothetical protein